MEVGLSAIVKLASIAVHVDELLYLNPHPNDIDAIKSLLKDPELRDTLADLDRNGLLPIRRDHTRYAKELKF